jgi:hypothetical protein
MYLFRHKGSHDIDHRTEKERLKKEYFRRLRLVLGTELSAKNKIQAFGQYQHFDLVLEFLNVFKENCTN